MATVTLTFSAAQAARIQSAFEGRFRPVDENGDPRSADLADFKGYLVEATRKLVQGQEKQEAIQALSAAEVDIT